MRGIQEDAPRRGPGSSISSRQNATVPIRRRRPAAARLPRLALERSWISSKAGACPASKARASGCRLPASSPAASARHRCFVRASQQVHARDAEPFPFGERPRLVQHHGRSPLPAFPARSSASSATPCASRSPAVWVRATGAASARAQGQVATRTAIATQPSPRVHACQHRHGQHQPGEPMGEPVGGGDQARPRGGGLLDQARDRRGARFGACALDAHFQRLLQVQRAGGERGCPAPWRGAPASPVSSDSSTARVGPRSTTPSAGMPITRRHADAPGRPSGKFVRRHLNLKLPPPSKRRAAAEADQRA